mmetsp:Transcript_37328/g.116724  ORF Transcript_37328/g.116724 Transcript_37328/m.116724 type:complete len:247 (-) Transcript_37328:714-1454(-)
MAILAQLRVKEAKHAAVMGDRREHHLHVAASISHGGIVGHAPLAHRLERDALVTAASEAGVHKREPVVAHGGEDDARTRAEVLGHVLQKNTLPRHRSNGELLVELAQLRIREEVRVGIALYGGEDHLAVGAPRRRDVLKHEAPGPHRLEHHFAPALEDVWQVLQGNPILANRLQSDVDVIPVPVVGLRDGRAILAHGGHRDLKIALRGGANQREGVAILADGRERDVDVIPKLVAEVPEAPAAAGG